MVEKSLKSLISSKKTGILLNNKAPHIEKENKYKRKIKVIFEGNAYLSKVSKNNEKSKEIRIRSGYQIKENGKYKIRFISKKQKQYNIFISLKKINYLLLILPFILFLIIMILANINTKKNYEANIINKNKLLHIFYPESKKEYISQYCFEIDAKGFKNTNFSNIRLADTINEKTLINNLIAPGTSGSFDIIIKTKGGDLDVNYLVEVQEETASPENLVFCLKGDTKYYHSFSQFAKEKLIGSISKDAIKTLTIEWKWNYEKDIENNKQDTKDGQTLKEYTFKMRAIGKNKEETHENK